MRFPKIAVLPLFALASAGCAPAEATVSSSSEVVSSSPQVLHATSWTIDPLLFEPDSVTQVLVFFDPDGGTLNVTVVRGLLPYFFETQITKTWVDTAGAQHTFGVSASDAPERCTLELVDGASELVLTLDGINPDGTPTHSLIHIAR
jgi:hypothetical protein